MSAVFVDHLVIGARTLAEGVAWCEATLGVVPGPGGRHPLMGTHNRLLKIAGAAYPDAYLEIIAIDPGAPAPARRRWFGLDEVDLRAGPRLLHVVAQGERLQRAGRVHVERAAGEIWVGGDSVVCVSGELAL